MFKEPFPAIRTVLLFRCEIGNLRSVLSGKRNQDRPDCYWDYKNQELRLKRRTLKISLSKFKSIRNHDILILTTN